MFKLGPSGSGLAAVQKTGTSTGLVTRGGNVVFLNDETSRPNELFVLVGGVGPARQITHFNDEAVARLDLGKVESYSFKGASADDIQAGWSTRRATTRRRPTRWCSSCTAARTP